MFVSVVFIVLIDRKGTSRTTDAIGITVTTGPRDNRRPNQLCANDFRSLVFSQDRRPEFLTSAGMFQPLNVLSKRLFDG